MGPCVPQVSGRLCLDQPMPERSPLFPQLLVTCPRSPSNSNKRIGSPPLAPPLAISPRCPSHSQILTLGFINCWVYCFLGKSFLISPASLLHTWPIAIGNTHLLSALPVPVPPVPLAPYLYEGPNNTHCQLSVFPLDPRAASPREVCWGTKQIPQEAKGRRKTRGSQAPQRSQGFRENTSNPRWALIF